MPVASLPFFILLCFVLLFFIVSFDIGSLAIVPLAISLLDIAPLACANAAVVARVSAVASAATITFFMTCLLCWQWIKNPQFLRHDSNNGHTRRTVDRVDGFFRSWCAHESIRWRSARGQRLPTSARSDGLCAFSVRLIPKRLPLLCAPKTRRPRYACVGMRFAPPYAPQRVFNGRRSTCLTSSLSAFAA